MNNIQSAFAPRRSHTLSTLYPSNVFATVRDGSQRCWLLAALTVTTTAVLIGLAQAQTAPDDSAIGGAVAGAVIANGASAMPGGARLDLVMGQPVQVTLPEGSTYYVLSGRDNLTARARNGTLELQPTRAGRARLIVAAPGEPERDYNIFITDRGGAMSPAEVAVPITEGAVNGAADVSVAPVAPAMEVVPSTPVATDNGWPYAPPSDTEPFANGTVLPANGGLNVNVGDITLPSPVPPDASPVQPSAVQMLEVPASPDLWLNTRPVNRREMAVTSLPQPADGEHYPVMRLTQGMAKLIPSDNNVLAVFFSNDNVMDARAVNARTIAITGKMPGQSTLAIFKARNARDVVGEPEIYTVVVVPPSPRGIALADWTPESLQSSIDTAINDPRIQTRVFETPDGGLVVRLSGTVRDAAEKQSAERVVELFGMEAASAIVVDANAPTIAGYLAGPQPPAPSQLENWQAQLRMITGNPSITLVDWPTGLIMTGEVNSMAEAEQLLSLAPGLGRHVTPIIRIRGNGGAGEIYQSSIPQLSPEDSIMTRRMQNVTGIPTVYTVRTAFNAIAVTGTVNTRSEYDRVRKYASLLPQLTGGMGAVGAPVASGAESGVPTGDQGTAPAPFIRPQVGLAPGIAPATGYEFPTQIQMFVRITDPTQSSIRQVTVDTSIVEISRNAMRNLGVEVGSATLLSEQVTAPTAGSLVVAPDGTQTITGGTPGSIQREIDPTFRSGLVVGGNGFIGSGGFSLIDPIRVRLNALFQNGDARILSNPNLTMLEGAEAQLIVGGQRPIIRTTINEGSVAQEVDFRPFGIILTARPTVGGDDTITLQIRAEVTELDFTTAINVGGAQIPGERSRSVDTILTMKPGDTLVMGGLIANERRKEYSRVPLLSQIPILGELFKSKRFVNDETELAIFMTPNLRRIAVDEGTFGDIMSSPNWPTLRPSVDGLAGSLQGGAAGTGQVAQPVR